MRYFYSGWIRTLVAMASYIFLRVRLIIMGGKVEIGIFFCLSGESMFLQKYLFNSPLYFIRLLSKSLNLIGCQCDNKGKLSKEF